MYLYYIIETDSTMLRKLSVIFQSILLLGLLLQVSSQWTRWGSWSSCTNLRQSRERTLTKRQTRRCRGNLKLNCKALFSRSLFRLTDGSNPIFVSFIDLFFYSWNTNMWPESLSKRLQLCRVFGKLFLHWKG